MAVSAVKSEPAPAEAAPQAKSKKGLVKLVLIAVVGLGAAGGGAWWYLGQKGGEAAQEAKQAPAKPPVFYPLETFTVNLVLVDNPQFLQTGITLKVADAAVVDALKLHTPVVRDRILMLMSSRKAADLLTVEGKRKLAEEIVASMNEILGAGEIKPAAKTADAKGADAKGADAKADKDDEDEKDAAAAKDGSDGKADKDGKSEKADAAGRPVQAVLFTTFIIQ